MFRRWLPALLTLIVVLAGWGFGTTPAQAQGLDPNRFYHYPYYYFPHNYWPSTSLKWPEPAGAPYMPAPAYMAYPPFREPHWRYEWWMPQNYYRGSHFWLDVF
jgi:hypothetical protein